MTTKEFYEKLGENYNNVLGRFGSDATVTKFVLKFSNDLTYKNLLEAVQKGNAEEAFRMAHTLKGLCINLGFGTLYNASFDLTEDLRDRKLANYEENLERVKQAYAELTAIIKDINN